MKKMTIWATALTMSIALFSCNKDMQEPVLAPEQEQETDNVPRTLYTANSDIAGYTIIPEEEEEGLRASVLKTGYVKPKLDVTKTEFDGKNIYWRILGEGVNESHKIVNLLDAKPSGAPADNAFVFYKENDKRKFMLYANVPDAVNVSNKFAMLSLDGTLRDDRFLDFKDAMAPNVGFAGLKTGEKIDSYHFPIMTDILPFNKVFNVSDPVHYRPRGVMIAISVLNNNCHPITVKAVEFQANNALAFEGSFDTWTAEDGTDIKAASSAGVTTAHKAKFIPAKLDQVLTYNVSDPALAVVDRHDELLHDNIDKATKEKARTFYVWGYPLKNGKQLKFKLIYRMEGKSADEEKVCTIDAPTGDFQDGYAYQLPILIARPDDGVETRWEKSLGFRTPLDFLAPHPINKACSGFVTDYDKGNADLGRLEYMECAKVFRPSPLNQEYILPTYLQWHSIFIDDSLEPISSSGTKVVNDQIFCGEYVPAKLTLEQWIAKGLPEHLYKGATPPGTDGKRVYRAKEQIGGDAPQIYENEFWTIVSCHEKKRSVCYAIRAKGTKWECAWRYAFFEETDKNSPLFGHKFYRIHCVPLGANSGKTLEDISTLEFFLNNECTIRTIPEYPSYRNRYVQLLVYPAYEGPRKSYGRDYAQPFLLEAPNTPHHNTFLNVYGEGEYYTKLKDGVNTPLPVSVGPEMVVTEITFELNHGHAKTWLDGMPDRPYVTYPFYRPKK